MEMAKSSGEEEERLSGHNTEIDLRVWEEAKLWLLLRTEC